MSTPSQPNPTLESSAKTLLDQAKEMIGATLWEAAVALGNQDEAERRHQQAKALKVPGWMLDSTETQVHAIQALQARIAPLIVYNG